MAPDRPVWTRIAGDGQPSWEDRDDGLSLYARDLAEERPAPRLHVVPEDAPSAPTTAPDPPGERLVSIRAETDVVMAHERAARVPPPVDLVAGFRLWVRHLRSALPENEPPGGDD